MVDNTDITNPKEEENQEKQQESNRLASFVYDRFITSERARQSDEDRWLEAFHNGVDAFEDKKYTDAIKMFEQADNLRPDGDPTSRQYIERCVEKQKAVSH